MFINNEHSNIEAQSLTHCKKKNTIEHFIEDLTAVF